MPNVLSKFLRLQARDQGVLVRAVVTLAAARLATWLVPFEAGRRFLTRGRRPAPSGVTREQIRWAIAHASRVVPKATCLPQALAAESLLARSGLPAELHIGVRKTPDGTLEAHAWVESNGRIVVGDLPWGLDGYTRLPKLPDVWREAKAPGRQR